MKASRRFRFLTFLSLGLVALALSAGVASAQNVYEGSFTLPFQAQWGKMVLPPGEYSFTLDKGVVDGLVKVRTSERYVGMIFANGISNQSVAEKSELVAVGSEGFYQIRALRLSALGIQFEYKIPEGKHQLLAQGPQLIRHVLIAQIAK